MKPKIHPSIKVALGYGVEIPDPEFRSSWKDRTSRVCKPCWELKYCPYGPLVEQSPTLPTLRADAASHNAYIQGCLANGLVGSVSVIGDDERAQYAQEVAAARENPLFLLERIRFRAGLAEQIATVPEEQDMGQALGLGQVSMEHFDVPFPMPAVTTEEEGDEEEVEEGPPPTAEEAAAIELEISRMETALQTGQDDRRHPLEPARRRYFERLVASYRPQDHPEEIPEFVADASCNVFGHVCPVFFVAEHATETSMARRRTRHIPFAVKMRVVRRDNHTCQECGKHLKDNEVEFDHVIPYSKGGSSEEHNIRLTCFDCNRSKSDDHSL